MESNINNETRRDFIEMAPPRMVAASAGIGAILNVTRAAAQSRLHQFAVCREYAAQGSLLEQACSAVDEDNEENARLLESLRSSPAFREMAPAIFEKVGKKHTFRALYAGSGSHIAPIEIAMFGAVHDLIKEAEFVFTEVRTKCIPELDNNLRLLAQTVPGFSYEPPVGPPQLSDCGETTYVCDYHGKKTIIRLKLNCSKDLWFEEADLNSSDLFISHDPQSGAWHAVELYKQYLLNQSRIDRSSRKLPLIIGEDTTRVYHPFTRETDRAFDLELLGKITRGKERYGHHHAKSLTSTTDAQEFELGDAYTGSALIDVNPALFRMSSDDIDRLIGLSLNGNGVFASGDFGHLHIPNPSESTNSPFIFEMLNRLKRIDSRLARAFCFRVLGIILKSEYLLVYVNDSDRGVDPNKSYDNMYVLIDHLSKYLNPSDRRACKKDIEMLKSYIALFKKKNFELVKNRILPSKAIGLELGNRLFYLHERFEERGDKIFEELSRTM